MYTTILHSLSKVSYIISSYRNVLTHKASMIVSLVFFYNFIYFFGHLTTRKQKEGVRSMIHYPLTLRSIFERAEKMFPKKEIVSRNSTGIFRYTYADYARRTRRLSSALLSIGVKEGVKVATFAWNDHRHLEAYFAIPCMGAVLHTINIRLSLDHITYIINHAKDQVLLIDEGLLPIIEKIQGVIPSVKAFVVLSDSHELPTTSLSPVYSYEALLESGDPNFVFSNHIDENAPMG